MRTKFYVMKWAADKVSGRPTGLKIDDMPNRVDLLGNPVLMTPKGRSPAAYWLIDTTKASAVPSDEQALELRRVFDATNDSGVIPTITERVTWRGQPVLLQEREQARLKEIHGKVTRWALTAAMRGQNWNTLTMGQKAQYLNSMNGKTADWARELMLDEMRQRGRIR
jgi:hypothetical protein